MSKQTQVLSLAPTNFEEAERFAVRLANSNLCPKDYKGKPDDILIAMQMGAELGLKPMQAIQNIAVINGRPAIWGDAALAVIKAHPDFEDINEWWEGEGDKLTAFCTIKRRNQTPQTRKFSIEQAKTAGLSGKTTWQQFKERMLQMRARGFCGRDTFPDALKGIMLVEEVQDIPTPQEKEINPISTGSFVDSIKSELGILPQESVNTPILEEVKEVISWLDIMKKIDNCLSLEELKAIGKEANNIEDEHKEKVRDHFKARKTLLELGAK